MLINHYMPEFDTTDKYDISINAGPREVWEAVKTFNLCESTVVSTLFWMRGLPSGPLTLGDLEEIRFKTLAEENENEIVIGIIGKFWSFDGKLLDFDATRFVEFKKEGFATAAWNFRLIPDGNSVRLETETRVNCFGSSTRASFDFYWALVRPFSGWIRKEMLKTIKKESEGR